MPNGSLQMVVNKPGSGFFHVKEKDPESSALWHKFVQHPDIMNVVVLGTFSVFAVPNHIGVVDLIGLNSMRYFSDASPVYDPAYKEDLQRQLLITNLNEMSAEISHQFLYPYAAVDEDGRCYTYKTKPTMKQNCSWWSAEYSACRFGVTSVFDWWETSLCHYDSELKSWVWGDYDA